MALGTGGRPRAMSGPGLEDPSTLHPPIHLPSIHPPIIHPPTCHLPSRPPTQCLLSTHELAVFWAVNKTDTSPCPREAYETEAVIRLADGTGAKDATAEKGRLTRKSLTEKVTL